MEDRGRREEIYIQLNKRRKKRVLRIKELQHCGKGSPGDLKMKAEVEKFVSLHLMCQYLGCRDLKIILYHFSLD